MSNVPVGRRADRTEKDPFVALHHLKYFLTDTGKVVKRINPKALTRERRKLKAYARLLYKEEISYSAIEQAYKSWMGAYAPIMSKKQIRNIKKLYKELFRKEPQWKQ